MVSSTLAAPADGGGAGIVGSCHCCGDRMFERSSRVGTPTSELETT